MFGQIFKYLPLIMSSTDLIGKIRASLNAGKPVLDVLAGDAPQILNFLKQVGSTIWPNLSQSNQVQAAAMAVYDPEYVKSVQTALHKLGLLKDTKDIDGYYGPKTKAVAAKFQTDHGIEPADGWIGPKSKPVLDAEANKLHK